MPNLFSTFKQVTRLDYYGNEYKVSVLDDCRLDLGELWKRFNAIEQVKRNDTGQYQGVSGEWVEREAEKQLNEKQD